MATYIKPPKSNAQGIADIISGFGDVYNDYLKDQQEQRKLAAKNEEFKQMQDYLESIGLSRDDINLPKSVLGAKIKKAEKGRSFFESFGDYFFNNKGAPAPRPNELREGLGGMTKEQADALRAQGVDVGLPNEPTSLLQKLSGFGSGIGQGLLSVDPRFLGQNLVSGGLGLTNMLGKAFGAEKNIVPDYETLQEKGRGLTESFIDKLIQKAGSKKMADFYQKSKETHPIPEPLRKVSGIIPPTSSQVTELAKEASKGTPLEKFAIPQTETQKQYEDLGNVVGVLMNPSKAITEGGAKGLAKNFAKATGIALGGDAAGWLTENATGSKTAGDVVRNGTYILSNLFPGTIDKLAKKAYNSFDNQVIKKAEKLGKKMNIKGLEDRVWNLSKRVEQMSPGAAKEWLINEFNILGNTLSRKAVNPQNYYTYLKEFNKRFRKAPDQAKIYGAQLKNALHDQMYKFANQVTPGSAQLLKDADRLYRTNAQIGQSAKNLKQIISGNLLLGPALLFTGGYKKLLAAGAGYQAARYLNAMLRDPSIRASISQLARASAANNTVLMKRLLDNIDKRSKEIDPKAAQELTAALRKR